MPSFRAEQSVRFVERETYQESYKLVPSLEGNHQRNAQRSANVVGLVRSQVSMARFFYIVAT